MQIKNNNIRVISPDGKVFYSTLTDVKNQISILLGAYQKIKVTIKGRFDGLIKGTTEVLEFKQYKLNDVAIIDLIQQIENDGAEIMKWKFKSI